MDDKMRKKLVKGAIEAINSLRTSIQKAGGDGESLTDIKEMESMTVLDFMSNVAAPNGIRFHFEDKTYEEAKKEDETICPCSKKEKTICPCCHQQAAKIDGVCTNCGWKQVKTKEDLNDIEVHTQPD